MNSEYIKSEADRLLFRFGQVDGSHHKTWVIDQLARLIFENDYEKFVHRYEYYDEEADEYLDEKIFEWDCGIAP